MARKPNTIRSKKNETKSRKSKAQPPLESPYSSLAQSPTPLERRAALENQLAERGIRPLNEEALLAMADVWPPDESIDEFLAWLRESRREDRGR